ncbi:hypothetical protein [Lacrimispora sp.]|uniref:hypothetical protein n=1 Tax=Lacrimispora sp. TaxID=2719234 RepID=UPI0028AEAFB9|nr:hypothetical protein [Lacrimispora sp.]
MNILYNQDTEGCIQEAVILEWIVLAGGILTAEILAELMQMPEGMKEAFYPYEERPEMILADDHGKSHMTFQLLDKKLNPEETGKAAEAVREYISRMYPRNELSPVHLYRKGKFLSGWFAMELEEAEEVRQHVKAVLSVQGQMFLTTATYPEQDRLKWEVLMKHFYETLHEIV